MIRPMHPRPTVVAFTGTRTFCNADDRSEIVFTVHRLMAWHRLMYFPAARVGDCKTGVDAFVRYLFADNSPMYSKTDLTVVEVDPKIQWPGKGPERNSRIIGNSSKPIADLLLSFPRRGQKNAGTIDCTTKAIRAGVEVVVTYLEEEKK